MEIITDLTDLERKAQKKIVSILFLIKYTGVVVLLKETMWIAFIVTKKYIFFCNLKFIFLSSCKLRLARLDQNCDFTFKVRQLVSLFIQAMKQEVS